MAKFLIHPSSLKGTVAIPPSKSHTLRALAFAMMASGKSIIRNYLPSPDTYAMVNAIQQFGSKVNLLQDQIEVTGLNGSLLPAENVIDAGNSGLVLRFIAALAALNESYTIITGDDSIRRIRPVQPLLTALEQLGAFARSSRLDGHAPIIIKGPIRPGKAFLPGEDSQPVSGLLIAGSFLSGESEIHVQNPGEKPWIDMTLYFLDRLDIRYENHNYERYRLFGHAGYPGFDWTIPGDFSTASFPIAAALTTDSELTLLSLDMEDVQGDKKLISILNQMGAKIETDTLNKTVSIQKPSILYGMQIDVNDCIDTVPLLAVIGCFAKGRTHIVNAAIARKKESDRIHAICTELKKMGAIIEETPDGLVIQQSELKGAHLNTYRDHRIALSLAVAALSAKGPSTLDGIECIDKTYPHFLTNFQHLGAKIEEHA